MDWDAMKKLMLMLSMLIVLNAHAFEIEEKKPGMLVSSPNDIPIVMIDGETYSLFRIPNTAPGYEISPRVDTHAELKSTLKMGDPVTQEEVVKILKVFYWEIARDYDGIRLRNLKVGGQTYAVWCTNTWLFGCLEWTGAAGTLVQFEVNEKNRSGGMTGYEKKYYLMRNMTHFVPYKNPF